MALTTVNSDGVKDDSIKNIDVKSDAAIAGTKIAPDFGSQNIVTTGKLFVGTTALDDFGSSLQHNAGASGSFICLGRNDTTVADANGIGGIRFFSNDTNINSGNYLRVGEITCAADGDFLSGDAPTKMTFSTMTDGTTTLATRMTITSNGNLLLGTDTETNNIRLGNKFGIAGTTAYTGMSITNYSGTTASYKPLFDFNRSRGASDGSFVAVEADDGLGEIVFRGSGTSAFADAAAIRAYVDTGTGTAGNSDMPGKLTFSTSKHGEASVVERLRIDSAGHLEIPFADSSTGLRQKIRFITESPHFDEVAYLSVDRTATSLAPSDMVFATGPVGSVAERLRITSAGYLGLGTNSPQRMLHIAAGSATGLKISGNNTGAANGDGFDIFVRDDDNGVELVQREDSYLTIHTDNTERFRIDSSGRLQIGSSTNTGYNDFDGVGRLNLNNNSADGTVDFTQGIVFTSNASNEGTWTHAGIVTTGSTGYSGNLIFGTDGANGRDQASITEKMRLTAAGHLKLPDNAELKLGGPQDGAGDFQLFHNATSSYVYNKTGDLILDNDQTDCNDVLVKSKGEFTAYVNNGADFGIRCINAGNTALYWNGNLRFETFDNGIKIHSLNTGAGNSDLRYNSSDGVVTYDTSSRLVKTDIEDSPYGIDIVKQLKPRKYKRTDQQDTPVEIGFIADEVETLIPEIVPTGPKSIFTKDASDTELIPVNVDYRKLTVVLTTALQEAITKIETLETEVAALKAK